MGIDFADRVRDLAAQIRSQLPHIQTEEATKNALVMPFISALGYNVFNPTEVTPELHADVGLKKGEKVDYAVIIDGKPAILFECKWHGTDLGQVHASQLYRYFSVTEARFSVLTNGIVYWFFSDLEASNLMDSKPFFEFNLFNYREHELEELKKFTKSAFDLDDILTTATELKYTNAIQKILEAEFSDPSDEMIRFLLGRVYLGRLTANVRDQLGETVIKAMRQFINERVNRRLQTALTAEATMASSVKNAEPEPDPDEDDEMSDSEIVTTTQEIEAYYTIKGILHAQVRSNRIVMRDVKSYCGILLDDNNRKPLCRLYFDRRQKLIGLFDSDDRKEVRVPIEDIEGIYDLSDRLLETLRHYEED